MRYELIEGDCVEQLRKLEANSIDAVVTDPPYGLKFMGKDWDDAGDGPQQQEWHRLWAVEALRVLKPGGHLLAFGGSRTYHRLASAVEDAGFEIRDQIMWLYGSGFPKSLDVSKAIDKKRDDKKEIYQVTAWIREARDRAGISNKTIDDAFGFAGMAGHWTSSKSQPAVPTLDQVPQLLKTLGVEPDDVPEMIARLLLELNGRKGQPGENWFKREIVEERTMIQGGGNSLQLRVGERKEVEANITAPATEQAAQWKGWGTALKPAHEPIVVARKPLIGTVAANVLEHGTGAINVDGCRVGNNPGYSYPNGPGGNSFSVGKEPDGKRTKPVASNQGRWPANIILDEEAGDLLDKQSGVTKSSNSPRKNKASESIGTFKTSDRTTQGHADKGGASRFFYQAKASKKERNAGLDGFEEKSASNWGSIQEFSSNPPRKNNHPTVKPIELMRYLCRLVTPPGGTVLDPFLGSGTTGCAVAVENNEKGTDWNFIGIEREADYLPIARARIDYWANQEPN